MICSGKITKLSKNKKFGELTLNKSYEGFEKALLNFQTKNIEKLYKRNKLILNTEVSGKFLYGIENLIIIEVL